MGPVLTLGGPIHHSRSLAISRASFIASVSERRGEQLVACTFSAGGSCLPYMGGGTEGIGSREIYVQSRRRPPHPASDAGPKPGGVRGVWRSLLIKPGRTFDEALERRLGDPRPGSADAVRNLGDSMPNGTRPRFSQPPSPPALAARLWRRPAASGATRTSRVTSMMPRVRGRSQRKA